MGIVNADGITSIAKTNKLIKKAEDAYKKRDFKTVIQSYEAAIQESSDLPEQVPYNLGNAYLETKQFPKATKYFQSVVATAKSGNLKSNALQQLGYMASKQADYKTAMDFYKKSLKNNPQNEGARLNYELAYQLNKKKEEENKKNQPQNKDEQKKEENKPKDEKQAGKNQENKEGKEQQKENKEQANNESKQGPQKQEQKQDTKASKGDDKNASTSETDKKGENGQEEEDKEGKEKSKSKGEESNMDDPNAVKIDKKKLMESGLSEEQAKSLLQAMRNSEIKYLQQRRFGKKGKESSGKNRW